MLFSGSPAYYDSAGYLAHIGVELLIKSWLLEATGKFPGIHQLSELYSLLIKHHGAPELTDAGSKLLTTLDEFESLRYPNRSKPTEIGTEHWEMTEAFYQNLLELMPRTIKVPLDKDQLVRKAGRVLMKKKIDTKSE